MEATLDYRPAGAPRAISTALAATADAIAEQRERIAARVFDDLPAAMVVIDRRGTVVITNAAARALPAALACIGGHAAQLIRQIEQSGSGAVGTVSGERQFWLLAAPFGDGDLAGRALFTITITEPAAVHPVAAAAIAQLCGLTPCEAKTAEMILAGTPPKAMATALGVSLATVKTHLHRVFSKTGTRGQADFARRMARVLPPTL
jgi:DNA-binding CsgD family transcriptional regulator